MYWAGWPRHVPFDICIENNSHSSISHFDLGHLYVSILDLVSCILSIVGANDPTLALKSPHTNAFYCGGIYSRTELTASYAVLSSIFLRDKELAGGT